ncbi:uncharacterized protein LOC128558676 isoform X2 [Mercenaria mercenaria]|uniref:uncharacterized protein LOC128558676 isoform X2 n=1 Tax=Mercenaria mercenaria TaxID=6596 RepID=UPI00234F487B|nr:uncharacterized protein LOC128558676 isoform X2 [Mercenaria mercenaria]
MDSEQRKPFTSYMKKKIRLCVFAVGIMFLMSAIPYSVLLHRENGSRINKILKDMETLEYRMSSQNLDFSLKSQQFERGNQAEDRRKRDVDEHEEPKHVPHLYESDIVGGSWYGTILGY